MRKFNYKELRTKLFDTETITLIAKIDECKGRQELFYRQKPVELERLLEISKIQSTEASNKIEGIISTASRIKLLMNEKTTPKNRDEKEILGYRDVLNTIHESHDFIHIVPNHILQLHRDLLRHTDLSFGGKFKTTQNIIAETHADGTISTRFVPLEPFETPDAIEQICNSYTETLAEGKVHPLILIPTFIIDFLCIHPFNDGNGRMARLLTLLLLYRCGYDVGKYISIERFIEKTKEEYYESLRESGTDWHEETNDTTPFIKYMLEILLTCYKEFEIRVGLMSETSVKSSSYDIVKKYAMEKLGKFTSNDVLENCPRVARSSALNALTKLCSEGILDRHGQGKSTFYVRKE